MLDNAPDNVYFKHYTTQDNYPVLYKHVDYGGRPVALRADISNLSDLGFNDEASSIWIPRGWEVRLYWDADFKGNSIRLRLSDDNFHDINWGDEISSIRLIPPEGN